ncbi:asparagine synthetase [Palaeococcus pacificus DY20341]|uniref:Asparagine synthetase n=1 Tax=Palaeococcus pacificus DY20341 TaxID=1343739 RepID=A0A075LVM7_9EURY|nr:asparagine synthetase A [Palaeococcus pacificus]AIF70394.1 asparagine synthetase [Palaeococcus pacificus DY20341]
MNAVQLISRDISPILRVQTKVIGYMTDYFIKKGFKWLLPVMLSSITDPLWPDPAASKMRAPEIEAYGTRLKLMHSMILHKQMAIAMGLEKIFVLSPNIRLEERDRDDGRHAYEFTQLDFEMAYASMDDVMGLIEGLIVGLFDYARGLPEMRELDRELPKIKAPFKRFTMAEIEEEYGDDEEASKAMDEPFWIIDISREFYDREDPTKPGHFRNYDLIMPEGYGEVSSGGEREWQYEVILRKLKESGLSLEAFKPYLEVAKARKLKPSAGAGIGVERIVRFIVGAKHIAEVQPFPRIPGIPAVI